MKKLALNITLLAIAALTLSSVKAAGISVSPRELELSANVGETVSGKLTVKNPSNEVSLFEVYPDELEKIIKASPSSFILEAGESREVVIQITPYESGVFKTNISVVGTPVSKAAFNAGSGVKIPLGITSSLDSSWLKATVPNLPLSSKTLGIILLVLVLGSVVFVIRYGIKQIKN